MIIHHLLKVLMIRIENTEFVCVCVLCYVCMNEVRKKSKMNRLRFYFIYVCMYFKFLAGA